MASRALRALFILTLLIGAVERASICSAGDNANNATQIEYISPDGQLSSVSAIDQAAHASTATFVDNDTVSCALHEGETTFIIALPKKSLPDRFTFLNENAAACGELRIAVSNAPLAADSPQWTEVDGIVPFAHKRLFKLSMLGVETKFVRLSFRVENPSRRSAGLDQKAARVSDPFRASVLSEVINSNFAKLHAGSGDVSLASLSVAPLPCALKK
jgi:hypothetical protein